MASTFVSSLFKRVLLFVFLFQVLIVPSLTADKDEWRTRSIYQVLTDRFAKENGTEHTLCEPGMGRRCGGTWNGIRDHLDYIQNMGFDAIWISPVVGQIPKRTGLGDAYAGYWQQDLYSLNDEFGTEDELHELISDLHSRGMLIMLDVVTNHMAWNGRVKDIDYSEFHPFNDKKYFHDFCLISDYSENGDAVECWLGDSKKVPLPDLRTEDDEVREMFGEWISGMVSNYSIDGMRIDTVLHIEPDFFPGFMEAAGVFGIGEVMTEGVDRACKWEKEIGSIFNYAAYYAMKRAFAAPGVPMDGIISAINATKAGCDDPTVMGSFSENHDVARFANQTSDMALAKNVITMTMLSDGIPVIFQGQEQHASGGTEPYMNRSPVWEMGYNTTHPLYLHIQKLNTFRHHVIRTSYSYSQTLHYASWTEDGAIALRKGINGTQVVTVLTNDGENGESYDLDLSNHGYAPDTSITEVLSCEEYTVNEDGAITLAMEAGEPKVLYPSNLLYGSGLCDYDDQAPDDMPQPPQTTSFTAYPTTISGEAGTYSTARVSPLPGPFTVEQDTEPTETSGSGFTPEETGSSDSSGSDDDDESAAAAGNDMSSTLAMAVSVMVLCFL